MFNLNQGTNRQKRELFVAAVQSSSGDTLPVNLTIIPSAQKWVFNAIYQLAFPSLYSSNVCSMNRLVLTDKDEAEYVPFQSASLAAELISSKDSESFTGIQSVDDQVFRSSVNLIMSSVTVL